MKVESRLILLAATSALFAGSAGAQAAAQEDERVHRSAEGYVAGAGPRWGAATAPLKEQRTLATDTLHKPRTVTVQSSLGDSWIFDADAELFDDFDDDGYYRFVSVRFDADTYLSSVYVYAMLYLSADGETWEHYYSTDDFLIGGTVPDDEYFVETELVVGYPPGLYDVLIELYDADFGTFEDEFGPAESSALSLLPIEDATYDEPAGAATSVTITSEGGGGGSAGLLLPFLAGGLLWARRRANATDRSKLVGRQRPAASR